MNNVVRVVTRIQDQDDFQSSLVDGQFVKWNASLEKFTLASLDLNTAVVIAPASSTRNVIQPTGAAVVPLVIKAANSQSVNLTHWTDNNDTILVSISSAGVITGDGSGLFRLNADNLYSGTVPLARLSGITTTELSDTAGITNGQLANSSITVTAGSGLTGGGSVSLGGTITIDADATDYSPTVILAPNSLLRNLIEPTNNYVPLAIKGYSAQSVNLTNWMDSSNTILVSISASGVITGDGSGLFRLNADNLFSGTVPLARLSGITTAELSDTAGITNGQLANSSITVTAGSGLTGGGSVSLGGTITIDADATDYSPAVILSPNSLLRNLIEPTNNYVPLAIKGYSAQTANLTNWMDSNDIILVSISPSGVITGDGSGLFRLNADNLFSGTVPLARLSGITTTELSDTAGITNGQLANSSITVTAGMGLTGGGSVSLGGTITIDADATDYSPAVILSPNSMLRNLIEPTSNYVPLSIKGSVGQTASLTQWMDSSNTILVTIGADGVIVGDGSGLFHLNADNLYSGTVPLARLSGITTNELSNTAGITNSQLANSSITVTAGTGLTGGGSVSLGGSTTLNVDFSAAVIIAPGSSTRNVIQPTGDFIPFVVKGSSSQTANLSNWANNSDVILASINSSGKIFSFSSDGTKSIAIEHNGTNGRVTASSGAIELYMNTTPLLVGNTSVGGGSWYGRFRLVDSSAQQYFFMDPGSYGIFGTGGGFKWTDSTLANAGTVNVGIGRNADGVLEVNSGTAGTYRDIICRKATLSGGGVFVDNFQGFNFKSTGGVANYSQIFVDDTNGAYGGVNGLTFFHNGSARIVITPSGLVSFGQPTSSFPAIKRNGTGFSFRLADDSGDAPIVANSATSVPLTVTGASSQSANLTEWKDSSGNLRLTVALGTDTTVYSSPVAGAYGATFGINSSNYISFATGGGLTIKVGAGIPVYLGATGLTVQNGKFLSFTSQSQGLSGDVSLYRAAAGVLEVNSGTASDLRDLKARNLYSNGNPVGTGKDIYNIVW